MTRLERLLGFIRRDFLQPYRGDLTEHRQSIARAARDWRTWGAIVLLVAVVWAVWAIQ